MAPTPASDPIDGVLKRMDEIIAWSLAAEDRAGYFAALYRRVTATVRERIGTGYFDDDARMETLDVVFASRYLTAFDQWRQGDPAISRCWQVAFQATTSPSLILLQHLLVGMNAHINYDLGIAAAQIAPIREQLESLHDDFDKINALLACLVPTVFQEIGDLSPLIHLAEEVDLPGEEKLVDVVMGFARDFAWLLANELVIVGGDEVLRQNLLALKDREVSWLGQNVVQPGKTLEAVAHVIWVAESKNVRKNIEELSSKSTLPAGCG